MKAFKNKAKLKGILGIALIVVCIFAIFLWENVGRENLMYEDIVVFNKDVEANRIVEKDMLAYMKVDKTTLIKGVITDPEDILGKETTTKIPRGLQLSECFFTEQDMALGDGRYIFSIPDDWIYSYPQTLRRGDTVYLYSIQKRANGEEAAYMEMNGDSQYITIPKNALLKTKVAYAKDSSNREVQDANKDSERMDGTAVVGNIEIYVTDKEYQALLSSYQAGNVLLILYN